MNKIVTHPNLVMLRAAGAGWAATPISARQAMFRRLRHAIVAAASDFVAGIERPAADTISAEILPLAEATAFLARRTAAILRPRRLLLAPLFLTGVLSEVRREPHGAVLILAPGNYPLFLPGVQALQALAAGNAVAVKPAPGRSAPMLTLATLLERSGLPAHLFQVLSEAAGADAVAAGFDHIVLTGGERTGLAVARAAAELGTPTTMELSGVDACYVLPGADLAVVAAALAYGLRLNAGATCIAPRRVFVRREQEGDLLSRLLTLLPPPAPIPASVAETLAALVAEAEAQGARVAARNPVVLAGARPEMALLQTDVFAPWLALVPVGDMEEALAQSALCPYALGASVFGPVNEARRLATRLRAGSVCINDLIAPTADPRLPFGGRDRSGHGVTRGTEGLLAMTAIKTVSTQRLGLRPHLDKRLASDTDALLTLLTLLHGGWAARREAIRRSITRTRRSRRDLPDPVIPLSIPPQSSDPL